MSLFILIEINHNGRVLTTRMLVSFKKYNSKILEVTEILSSNRKLIIIYHYIGFPHYLKVGHFYEAFRKLKWHEAKKQLAKCYFHFSPFL